MSLYHIFETDRLLLKPTSEEDAEFILTLVNSPKWLQFIGDRNVKTRTEAIDYIRSRMLPQLERLGFSNYTVIRKSDMHPVGTCGLYDREGLEGIDIGFAFLPEFEGFGYATEASHRLLHAAFDIFGIHEIKAITTKENISSRKLLEKLGMTCTGTTLLPNDRDELLVYIIHRHDHFRVNDNN